MDEPEILSGSSPRVRGKQGQCLDMLLKASDHPRACGANRSSHALAHHVCGSSPRVRGKRCRGARPRGGRRIIPARAGQTSANHVPLFFCSDHPRACGANAVAVRVDVSDTGSSPRVRGKRQCSSHGQTPRRIIPARAGQTGSRHFNDDGHADHPRACGANDGSQSRIGTMPGSSPRVRGKPGSLR